MSTAGMKNNRKRYNIIFVHPDLGIGGAERLILDAALSLQALGHKITIYTSHRDKSHCFDEARDGTLDVRVHGDKLFPAHIKGRFHVLMAILRQLSLVYYLSESTSTNEDEDEDDVFIVDQVPACVPVLRVLRDITSRKPRKKKQRTLFYCHFPDQLLARRGEGGLALRALKMLYRFPFDWFEGWAMNGADRIVVNSRFTKGVVREVFGNTGRDVQVVYPCVDTKRKETSDVLKIDHGELWGGLKILLSINRFERKKNIELAIRAYHGIAEADRKGTRLVIAGGYDNRVSENVQYHKELDALATQLGFQTATSQTVVSAMSVPDSINVLFLLSVPSAFKETLLSSSSLLLYTPSYEHFGIVPVEAMYAGLPVLADNTGGPLETIVEGKTGWLRSSKEISGWTEVINYVLQRMLTAERLEMANYAKQRVEKEFSLHAMGERLQDQIDEMVQAESRAFLPLGAMLGLGLVLGVVSALLIWLAMS
ncbi:alpha-1,3-mannosyltransferase alg-2 [Nannizzia gypsea CBS 118893]|uniref:Alpha-1,3/1,6-mannosyltransferase ALG2 n=1 Tax=Arthroderma gypseum (strain ATCC MYA-4604 / CBS 118893) TaxID=535722 RepID=E5R2Q8_ARTGP|nr:alpha-1,3-mannosyltransferase alg-2 [Nannizzia gypsea CBS 118893]EFQ97042.1 alpha-1,3-mannosyltransferase alg-2 [Nannizzia gypsea CBS 118893]